MTFVSLSISGAVSGAIYSLLAIGLVLSYSTSRIFNFGHAATAFACAYLYYQLYVALGWNKWLTLFVVLFIFAPGMGWIWDKLVFSRLSGAEEATKIVCGVGVLIVVPAITVYVCDQLKDHAHVGFADVAEVYQVPGILPIKVHKVTSGLVLDNNQLMALGCSIVLFILLFALLRFTPLGLQMRSAVDSPALARLRGISTSRVSTLSWMMSFFMAGIAGVLAAPFPGPFGLVNDNYTLALFVATTAAVVGGLRSIPLAFIAGLAIGALRNLVVAYVNGDYLGTIGTKIANIDGLTASVPYFVLFAALILLGADRKRRKAGTTAASGKPLPDYQDDLAKLQKAIPLVIRAAIILVPGLFWANGIWRQLIITGFATGIVFLSFTVVLGIGGMVSLAQGTFATAAAMTTLALTNHGWPFIVALLFGMCTAGVVGAITALPAMRLSGLNLTFATLALALLGTSVLFKIDWYTNGTLGWPVTRPKWGPIDFNNQRTLMVIVFLLMLLVAWIVSNLQKSAAGRAMIAVRTAEPAAAASAVSPQKTKLLLFVISAMIAGLGGVMMAIVYTTPLLGTANPPPQSFLWLAAVVLFGAKRPASAIEAGVVTAVLPRFVQHGVHFGNWGWSGTTNDLIANILFGLGAITLANQPDGILAQQQRQGRERRDRKRIAHAAGIKMPALPIPAGLAILGGALAVVGTFLPWGNVKNASDSATVIGIDNGRAWIFTIIVGALILLLGLQVLRRSLENTVPLVILGVFMLLATLIHHSNLPDLRGGLRGPVTVTMGIGLWLIFAAGILAVVAGVWGRIAMVPTKKAITAAVKKADAEKNAPVLTHAAPNAGATAVEAGPVSISKVANASVDEPVPVVDGDELGSDPLEMPYVPPAPGVLEVHNLHAAYGEVEVLHGVTFSLQQGKALALLGANGSGKTTLCSVIAGLVPVKSGKVIFEGEDISSLTPMARVDRGIVLVPESRGVFPSITVDENLQIWLPNRAERAQAYNFFEPLARRKSQPAGNLSGGEQQMLSLAPFLVRRPKLLISDEPSLGLAQIITVDIMAAIKQLQEEGTTIMLVEEKARDVLTIADQVGALQRGELQWINDRADVDEERVAAAYLGMASVVGS